MAAQLNSWIYDEFEGMTGLNPGPVKTLFSESSAYQKIEVLETEGLGRVLSIDGKIATMSREEALFNEMLVHVPMFSHPRPMSVAIIGGGDGGAAREVLRHGSGGRVVIVEKDRLLIEACTRHLPDQSYVMDDFRVDIEFVEPSVFLDSCDEKFDLIIVDPKSRSEVVKYLSASSFILSAAEILRDDGIIVFPIASVPAMPEKAAELMRDLRSGFERLHVYTAPSGLVPDGVYGFGFASGKYCPSENFDLERFNALGLVNSYYNDEVHRSSFNLGGPLKEKLKNVIDSF